MNAHSEIVSLVQEQASNDTVQGGMCLVSRLPGDSGEGNQTMGGQHRISGDVPFKLSGPTGPIDEAEVMQRWNAEGCVFWVFVFLVVGIRSDHELF